MIKVTTIGLRSRQQIQSIPPLPLLALLQPDEPPPELPETLNAPEHQSYISKLIHWGFEASKRERSRPPLVERDDDPEGES